MWSTREKQVIMPLINQHSQIIFTEYLAIETSSQARFHQKWWHSHPILESARFFSNYKNESWKSCIGVMDE